MIFTKNISRDLWVLSILTIFLGFYYFWLGFYFDDSGFWKWSLVGIIGASIIAFGQTTISANPLEVGLLTFWGARLPVIITEGNKLLAPFFPFLISVIRVPVSRRTVEFKFTVTAKNANDPDDTDGAFKIGGELEVEASIWYQPDYRARNAGRRIMQYLVSGGMKHPVKGDDEKTAIDVRLEQVTATIARTIALTTPWNEFMAMKAPLSAMLLMKIASTQFRRLPRSADGSLPESSFQITPEAYDRLPPESDLIKYLEDARNNPDEYRRRYKEVEFFLQMAMENGAGDVINLGIHLEKVNIENIMPVGDLAKAADDSAVEDAERVSELKDDHTGILRAQALVAAARDAGDETFSFKEAMEQVRINRGRAEEIIVRSSGNPLMDAAALNRRNS